MDWLIIIISIIFSAFFSGMEIAYISSNKLKLELATKTSSFTSKILSVFADHPSNFISAMLVGNNLTLVVYGIFMAKVLEAPISKFVSNEFAVMVIQTVISTLLILFVAEFLPKTLFRIVSNAALKTFSIPLIIFYYLFYPVVKFIMWLAGFFIKQFTHSDIEANEKEKAFGKIDIDDIIENSKSSNEHVSANTELRIFQNAMDFSTIKVRECMVPRNKIKAVPVTTEISELQDVFVETGHSNILVYKENIDEITGYVNIKDIFKNPQKLRSIMRQIIIVPETMLAKKLLEDLIKINKSLAVVVDEFGSTSGIVTIEDIMEEIFGEFEDEHDIPEFSVHVTKEGDYIISGHEEVDVFNEEFGLELSESDEYETIAGYILYHSGNFPSTGDIINIEDNNNIYKFKILKVQDTKIEKVMLYHSVLHQ
ncbi:MAG: hemolysin family protein [Bacteroidales bacterium]|jgi:CBS domain containing-hemolysin-like protein|nr:hemolysin family protein [Bacteroidales bacterium]